MAITTYSELKTAVGDWMARSDLSGSAADFITLAEARLNRELGAVETDEDITGTSGSRYLDITSLRCAQPIALFLAPSGFDEVPLLPRAAGTFAFRSIDGQPTIWSINGNSIDFDCPLNQDYPFRFRFRQRFALSDSATTNWLLTYHPDVYLAAALMWGGGYVRDFPYAATFKTMLDEGIPSVRSQIAQSKRGVLTLDPTLSTFSRNGSLPAGEFGGTGDYVGWG